MALDFNQRTFTKTANQAVIDEGLRAYMLKVYNYMTTGLVLTGSEVKSLRVNTGSIKESFIIEKEGELWLTNCYIKRYSSSSEGAYNTTRERKILVNKKQLNKIIGSSRRDGMTIVPITLYFNEKGIAKLDLGIAKGKRKEDKRETIKQRDWNRQKSKILKENN